MGSPIISFSCAKIRNALSRTDLPTSPYYDIIRHVNKITREWQMILYICACHSIVSDITHYLWVAYKTWLAIFINKVYNTDMKPRAHRVCTFSRLFSDFQNSSALRNTTESRFTKGRSCFAPRLIGQGKEMSVFFPHLSKAEHVRQRKISGKSILSTLPCSLRGRAPTTARTSVLWYIWPHRRRFRVPPAFE